MSPYQVLGVSECASKEEVKVAYRRLMKQYHPDLHPDKREVYEEKTKKLNTAYDAIMSGKVFNFARSMAYEKSAVEMFNLKVEKAIFEIKFYLIDLTINDCMNYCFLISKAKTILEIEDILNQARMCNEMTGYTKRCAIEFIESLEYIDKEYYVNRILNCKDSSETMFILNMAQKQNDALVVDIDVYRESILNLYINDTMLSLELREFLIEGVSNCNDILKLNDYKRFYSLSIKDMMLIIKDVEEGKSNNDFFTRLVMDAISVANGSYVKDDTSKNVFSKILKKIRKK